MVRILRLHEPLRLFIMVLGTSLIIFTLIFGAISYFVTRPVIMAIDPPFKICSGDTVKRGGVLCYKIHYYKFRPYPGELVKALIYYDDQGEITGQVPLPKVAGNLRIGEVNQNAYVEIPYYAPSGKIVRLKITSAHDLGVYTQTSEVLTHPFSIVDK
jgi:hypothetical protein